MVSCEEYLANTPAQEHARYPGQLLMPKKDNESWVKEERTRRGIPGVPYKGIPVCTLDSGDETGTTTVKSLGASRGNIHQYLVHTAKKPLMTIEIAARTSLFLLSSGAIPPPLASPAKKDLQAHKIEHEIVLMWFK